MFRRRPLLPFLLLSAAMAAPFVPALAQTPGTGVDYESRLSGLEEEMRGLNGRVEQLDYSVRRLDQALQRMQTDTDARLTRLEAAAQAQANTVPAQTQTPAQTPPQSAVVTPVQGQPPQPATLPPSQPAVAGQNPPPQNTASDTPVAPVDGTLGAVKIRDGRVTGAINNPQTPALPQVPADYGLTPQEQYDRAFGLLRQADYDGAEKAFKAFIDKNPKDKLADNAKYWYGETIYVRGRFDEAAVAFADAYQQNPQGNKAPDSLLKLAMSLAAIDKTQDACMTLAELRSKYPGASSSVRARADEQRAKLKCGSAVKN